MEIFVIIFYRTSSIDKTSMLESFQGCVHILTHVSITCASLAATINTKNDRVLVSMLTWINLVCCISGFPLFCWIILRQFMQSFCQVVIIKGNSKVVKDNKQHLLVKLIERANCHQQLLTGCKQFAEIRYQ